IDEVATHADAVRLATIFLNVILLHDVSTAHAARLADVKLIGKVMMVSKLPAMQPQSLHFSLHVRRHRVIMGEEIKQAEGVLEMIVVDASPLSIARLGPGKLPTKMPKRDDRRLFVVQLELAVAPAVQVQDVGQLDRLLLGGL